MIEPISGTLPADWKDHAVTRQINIYVGANETLIPQTYLVMDSIELTQEVCDGQFHLGGVIASRLKFTVNTDCITFGDDELNVEEHIVLDDDSEYDIPLGTYYIDRTDSVITRGDTYFKGEYVAYDEFVTRTDKVVTMNEAMGFITAHSADTGQTLYNLLNFIEQVIRIAPSNATKQLILAHPNNSRPGINVERDATVHFRSFGYYLHKAARDGATYRDVMSAVAVMLGGAFIIERNKNGQYYSYYKLVSFDASAQPVLTLSVHDRISSSIDTEPGRPIIRNIVYSTDEVENPISYNDYTDIDLSLGDLAIVQTTDESPNPAQSQYNLLDAMKAVSRQLGNWSGSSSSPTKVGEPIVLTNAEIEYFGDPTIEAGDFIRCSRQNGSYTDIYVMEHIYKPHMPSTIRSFGDANSNVYSSARNPAYGETKRPGGYDSAVARQMSEMSSVTENLSEQVTQIISSLDYSTDEHLIGTWIDGSELYEKTIVIPALGDGSTRTVTQAHGITKLGEVVESRGQLLGGGLSRPLQGVPISSDGTSVVAADGAFYSVSSNAVTVTTGTTDMSGCKAYVTLRYTHSDFPAWVPDGQGLAAVLENTAPATANYIMIVFETDSAAFPCVCYRACIETKTACTLESSNNHLCVYADPYSGNDRLTTQKFAYAPSTSIGGWYYQGQDSWSYYAGLLDAPTMNLNLERAIVEKTVTYQNLSPWAIDDLT